jgi:hypothetical protein
VAELFAHGPFDYFSGDLMKMMTIVMAAVIGVWQRGV